MTAGRRARGGRDAAGARATAVAALLACAAAPPACSLAFVAAPPSRPADADASREALYLDPPCGRGYLAPVFDGLVALNLAPTAFVALTAADRLADALAAAAGCGHTAPMTELLSSPEVWLSFATLCALEIVLGVDNIIFIAVLAGRLPPSQRDKARKLGLLGAFVSRLGLLAMISWIVGLDRPLFEIAGKPFTGKALILLGGGLFLLYKATKEIHHKLEAASDEAGGATARAATTFGAVILQVMLLDMVFSIDSVITAVGMTPYVAVMVAANVVALAVMLLLGKAISAFVERHPSVKVLALSFLLMIGLVLVAEGFGAHIPKGYIYGAMGFSVFVELINIRTTRKTKVVELNQVPSVRDIED